MELISTIVSAIIGFVSNPVVQQVGGALALAAVGAAGTHVIRTQPKVRDVAQDLADLEAEVGPWVREIEGRLLPGPVKYTLVLDRAKAWLASQGITGRKGRLILKYLPGFIEVAVKKVDPKLAPKKAV